MKFDRKIIIFVLLIIISLVVLIYVSSTVRGKANKQENLVKALQNSVDLQIKDFVYTEVGAAQSKWEVKAEMATYDKEKKLAVLDRVTMKLVTSDGQVYVMNADQGQIMTEEKNIEIKGRVVITSDKGDKFSTEYIRYDDAGKKFYTDAPVIMENKRMKITGKGLVIFMNKGQLSIPAMVEAKIN